MFLICGWSQTDVAAMTLPQIFGVLPTLYKVYGEKLVQGQDPNEKFIEATRWLAEQGETSPTFARIHQIAERL